jgi:hypothetical protein
VGLNDATRLVRAIEYTVDKQTAAGAHIGYHWGSVFEVYADDELGPMCSAYIEGNEDEPSEGFMLLNGMHVEEGDTALFAFDGRGHKWLEKVLPASQFPRMTIDTIRGVIYTGSGDEQASTPFEGTAGEGVVQAELEAHARGTTHLHTYNTPNSLNQTGLWSMIAEGEIDEQYGEIAAQVLVGGNGSNSTTWTRGLLRFRIRQQDSFGGNPLVTLEVVDGVDFSGANVMLIVTSVLGPTEWKLYVQLERAYEWLSYTTLWEDVRSGFLNWTPCVECVALGALPSGTQYAGTGVSSSHPDLATHDSMGLATDAELSAHTALIGDTNQYGIAHVTRLANDAFSGAAQPNAYPVGLSVMYIVSTSAAGWPLANSAGLAVTYRPSAQSAFGQQTWYQYGPNGNRVFSRASTSASAWTAWTEMSAPSVPDMRHKRTDLGTIAGSSSQNVAVTWNTAFANANYTVTVTIEGDNTGTAAGGLTAQVHTLTASGCTVRITNTTTNNRTGLIHTIAIAD